MDDARGGDGVLRLEGGQQALFVEPKPGKPLGRELQKYLLVLRPDDVDLRDVGDVQELRADVLHVVPQLAVGEAIRGEAVDEAEGVAELVVESRSDDAGGKEAANVSDLFPDLVPDVGDFFRSHRSLDVDEDRRLARRRVAAQIVEVGRLLELALDSLGQLGERVVHRGAGPSRLHDHGLDAECRVLAAPELEVGRKTRARHHEHQEHDEGAMPDRPIGEVQARHDAAPSSRTFCPGRST